MESRYTFSYFKGGERGSVRAYAYGLCVGPLWMDLIFHLWCNFSTHRHVNTYAFRARRHLQICSARFNRTPYVYRWATQYHQLFFRNVSSKYATWYLLLNCYSFALHANMWSGHRIAEKNDCNCSTLQKMKKKLAKRWASFCTVEANYWCGCVCEFSDAISGDYLISLFN